MKRRVEVVVARPIFEDVAKEIKLIGMRRMLTEETEEGVGRVRMGFLQVQVGDEQRVDARGSGR